MQIKREQTNFDDDKFKLVKISLSHDNDVLDRCGMCATMYPLYEKCITLKLNSAGLGFTLNVDEANDLLTLLTTALNEFKE
ncbi:hypothetical protein SEPL_018 [Salmonella phage SE_PL]|nr:hypothetical protein CPT_Munch_410 [Salmonella phage Munch]ELL7856273.1 hypothetical protein [Salmonella enterica]QCW19114.1 hypothetical protein 7t3_0597 [Salmonella phage 7t3]QIG62631.1 hypothetical protein SEPL_018 [Salmonella phage SE_PL]